MSAETMKMPEPIIEPTTIVVESNNPSPRTKPEESASAGSAVVVVDFTSGIRLLLFYFGGLHASHQALNGNADPAPDHAPWDAVEAATSRYSRARTPGFGTRIRSRITASESAPARYTSAARSIVIPPIATRGFLVICRAFR